VAYRDVSVGHAELIARDGLILEEIVRLADRLDSAFDRAGRTAPK
jgi:hypothetical protein